jgi:AraC-like DNA-binding protein
VNQLSIQNWDSQVFSEKTRFDAWEHFVSESYGKWTSNPNPISDFFAQVKTASAGGLKLIECVCDPCGASRNRQTIAQDESEFLAIQIVLKGREHMEFAGNRYALSSGDVFVWNTTQAMDFNVIEQLHKISLLIPLQRLKEWMPSNWYMAGGKLSENCTNRMLLKSMIMEMAQGDFDRKPVDDIAISEAVITMLTSSLSQSIQKKDPETLKEAQMYRIKKYISEHIDDPDLGVGKIAAANKISVRYVHWVFKDDGDTVSQHIMRERLHKAKRDLANPYMQSRSITEIAYSCGFSSSAHFSSRYKGFFGESPTKTRQSNCL